MPIQCSSRLGVLHEGQFQAALDRFGLGRFVSATPTKRGLFGQNVFVESSAGRFVLRGSPHNDSQLAHERFFARVLNERSRVPVPWPYLIDERNDIFGWTYAWMPCMPGLHLDEEQRQAMSIDDRAAIAATMGETLAEVAGVAWEHSGAFDLAAGATAAYPEGYTARLGRELRELIEHTLRIAPATIERDLPMIERLIAAGLVATAGFTPSPTTTDFGEGNATVERTAAGWRCAGVFDFMEWSMGDPERALVRSLRWYAETCPAAARAFLAAYHGARGLRPGAVARLSLYALADNLIIWNYGHSQATWWGPEVMFSAILEPALRAIGEVARAVSPTAAEGAP